MAHKVHHHGHRISKLNINVKISQSDKSAFVKTQIKCYINGTKSRITTKSIIYAHQITTKPIIHTYRISKPNTNAKLTKSKKSTFVKSQIKCYINGTKSRDYTEIQTHCISLIRQYHFPKSIYRHLHNWLHIESN